MQHRQQLDKASALYELEKNGHGGFDYGDYFCHISEFIDAADITIANLETPVGAPPYRGYPMFSAPAELAMECANSGIDVVLAANNHACDRGKAGMEGSLRTFGECGLLHAGIGKNGTFRNDNPLILECKGFRIGIINFTYGTNGIGTPEGFEICMMDSTEIKSMIFAAKMSLCDIIIAAPHWGEEYSLRQNGTQMEWESMLARNGVDIIIGTHPHVPQPVTVSKGMKNGNEGIVSITAYSLGNAISNMTAPFTRTGLMISIMLTKPRYGWDIEIGEPEIIPIWCARPGEISENYSIIPMKTFIGEKCRFKSRRSYEMMVYYYNELIKNGLTYAREKNKA